MLVNMMRNNNESLYVESISVFVVWSMCGLQLSCSFPSFGVCVFDIIIYGLFHDVCNSVFMLFALLFGHKTYFYCQCIAVLDVIFLWNIAHSLNSCHILKPFLWRNDQLKSSSL